MPEPDAFVQLLKISKSFQQTQVVHELSLSIERGEFFSLLGPSGCGKTTLLRMLAGFETPTAGRVLIDGADVTHLPAARRSTNMVFQSYAIFPHLDVAANIAFGLDKEGIDANSKRKRVADALDLVKLSGMEHRSPDQLSGGQRQRVALARAIVKRPKVLLLDEPLSALDKKLREQMQVELRSIQRELQTTFVFVTHDQQEALALSDRIAIMNAGKVAQVASPRVIYRQPANRFVADFIGSMNFFPATVIDRQAGNPILEIEGLGRVDCRTGTALATGQAVMVGIRPEDFALSTAHGKETPATVRGALLGVTYLGDKSFCQIQLPRRTEPVMVAMPGGPQSDDLAASPGTERELIWSPESMHVFDASPGD